MFVLYFVSAVDFDNHDLNYNLKEIGGGGLNYPVAVN